MHDYLLSAEWVRFAFVFGIAVSMLMYERRHLTTGSIVVPGYIAVFVIHPLVLVATFLNAFATYALVNKVLRRYVLVYGRTKFAVLAVISTLIQTAMLRLSPSSAWLWERDIPLFVGVGYIVPALIAHDMARQGISKTVTSVLLAGGIVAVPIAIALAVDLPGVNDLAPIGGFGTLAFPVQWLPIAVIVSIIASLAVAVNYRCRSGGFIGAAFVGMFMADLWQVAAALVIAAASYLIVAKLLMPHMILFGRRKFSAMLVTSSAIAWPALWFGDRVLSMSLTHHLAVGSLALTPLLLPGLIANDVQRTSPVRVGIGLSLAGLCTVTTTWWVGATLTGQHLHPGWKAVAATCVLVLGWPQFRRLLARLMAWCASIAPTVRSRTATVATVAAATRWRFAAAPPRARMAVIGAATDLRRGWARLHHSAIDGVRAVAPVPFASVAVGSVAVAPAAVAPAAVASVAVGEAPTWVDWARRHPDIAAEAEAWLDELVARRPTSSARAESDHAARVSPSEFGQSSIRLLAHSLQSRRVLGSGFAPAATWPRLPTPRSGGQPPRSRDMSTHVEHHRVVPRAIDAPLHAPISPRAATDDRAILDVVRALVEAGSA